MNPNQICLSGDLALSAPSVLFTTQNVNKIAIPNRNLWWLPIASFLVTFTIGVSVYLTNSNTIDRAKEGLQREVGSSLSWGLVTIGLFFVFSQILGILPLGEVGILLLLILLLPIALLGDTLSLLTLFEWLTSSRWSALFLASFIGAMIMALPQIGLAVRFLTIACGLGALFRGYSQ